MTSEKFLRFFILPKTKNPEDALHVVVDTENNAKNKLLKQTKKKISNAKIATLSNVFKAKGFLGKDSSMFSQTSQS